MNKSLLVTRPRHDETTMYLYYWASLVLEFAKTRTFSVYDLEGEKAKPELFKSYIVRNNPSLVFFNGHGNPKQIAGHNNEVLIEVNKNEDLLKGRVVYALSCSTATVLGKSCVDSGAKAYIGYTDEYVFATSADCISRPLQDNLAKMFLEPSNLVMTTLIKGNSVYEAYSRSKEALFKNLKFSLSSLASQEQKEVSVYLWTDINIFKVFGDLDSAIL